MNPWHLSPSDLLVWGIVLHLVADWPLQNDWMAANKTNLRSLAGYVHAGIHGLLLALIFGWAAILLAVVHLLIDTRKPVVWWSTKVIKQTQPREGYVYAEAHGDRDRRRMLFPVYDVGTEVRFWTDQVFHIICVAVAALLVA
jgi:hypothetical protein